MKEGALISVAFMALLVLTSCVTINVYPGATNPVSASQAPTAAAQLTSPPSPTAGFVMPVPINAPRPIDTNWSATPAVPGGARGPMSPSSRSDGEVWPDGDGLSCVRPCTPPGRAIHGEL